jgi:hypothetical protein
MEGSEFREECFHGIERDGFEQGSEASRIVSELRRVLGRDIVCQFGFSSSYLHLVRDIYESNLSEGQKRFLSFGHLDDSPSFTDLTPQAHEPRFRPLTNVSFELAEVI